jgi:hypothetical protein
LAGLFSDVYAIEKTMGSAIWFIIGVAIAFGTIPIADYRWGICLLSGFLVLSFVPFIIDMKVTGWSFLMGVIACYGMVCLVNGIGSRKNYWGRIARYTMPVFLMHTLCASPTRIVLFRLGTDNAVIHFIVGIAASFLGPVIVMLVLEKLKPLDFVVYPLRYLKIEKHKKENTAN